MMLITSLILTTLRDREAGLMLAEGICRESVLTTLYFLALQIEGLPAA